MVANATPRWAKDASYINPHLFLSVYRFLGDKPELAVVPSTELVIEGFPLSANTFAVVAFELSQKKKVKTAHHLHNPGQVCEAARLGIPAVVLIRRPLDAIASFLVRDPSYDVASAIQKYCRFYEPLLPLKKQVCPCQI